MFKFGKVLYMYTTVLSPAVSRWNRGKNKTENFTHNFIHQDVAGNNEMMQLRNSIKWQSHEILR